MIWKFDATDGNAAARAKAGLLRSISAEAPTTDLVLVELIFSELVGNVARHAPKSASVSYEFGSAGLALHVSDDGPGFAHRRYLPENPLSEGGRGLFLVESLSTKMRISRLRGGGSRVTAWLPYYRAAFRSAPPSNVPSSGKRFASSAASS